MDNVFGWSGYVALALVVSMAIGVGVAVAEPTGMVPIFDHHGEMLPQRFDLAQAEVSGADADGSVSTLPGGASSLNETYKDWRVACAQQGTIKRCALSQTQVQQNGQRVLAIELNPPNGNTVSGTLVLPFGLALDSGVTLQIDDKPAMQPMRFRTCLPGGCLVSVSFDAPTLVALRAGAALKVKAIADGGAAAPFSISLQGFAAALDRIGALSR